jgi:hypothetical protein
MTSNRFLLVGLVALVMLLLTDSSARGSEDYAIYGYGNTSCGAWTANRPKDSAGSAAAVSWVLGFVSGVGFVDKPLRKTDSAGMTAWIDQYCSKKPLDTLATAAGQMIFDLQK